VFVTAVGRRLSAVKYEKLLFHFMHYGTHRTGKVGHEIILIGAPNFTDGLRVRFLKLADCCDCDRSRRSLVCM